jgi:hypothetical protein
MFPVEKFILLLSIDMSPLYASVVLVENKNNKAKLRAFMLVFIGFWGWVSF